MLQAELPEQAVQPLLPLAGVEVDRLEDRQEVLLDRQLPEDRGLLRQVADPLPAPAVHGQVGDVPAVEHDAAAVRREQADHHVEGRRLARPVRTEEADHLAAIDADVHVVHDPPMPKRLHEAVRLEPHPAAPV